MGIPTDYLPCEARARTENGAQLEACGWMADIAQGAAVASSLGVPVRIEIVRDIEDVPRPRVLAEEALEEFQSALAKLTAVTQMLEDAGEGSAGADDRPPE